VSKAGHNQKGVRPVHVVVPAISLTAMGIALLVMSQTPSATLRAYQGELRRLEDALAGRNGELLIEGRPYALSPTRVLGLSSGTQALAFVWKRSGMRADRRNGAKRQVLDVRYGLVPFDLARGSELYRIGAKLRSLEGCSLTRVTADIDEGYVQPGDLVSVLGAPADIDGRRGLYGSVDIHCGGVQAWIDEVRSRVATVDRPVPALKFGAYFTFVLAGLTITIGGLLAWMAPRTQPRSAPRASKSRSAAATDSRDRNS
jgi:hypothetical protein